MPDPTLAEAAPGYSHDPGLLATLFASLMDDAPWAAFLDHLSRVARATWATLILTPRAADRPGLFVTPGADPAVGRDYSRRLFASDPFTGLPDGRVTHFRDFVSSDTRQRNAAYLAFLEQTSSDEVLGVDIRENDGVELRLRLTRAPDQPPFTARDAADLESLVPHLRIALQLFDRLSTGQTEQQIYAGAIEQMAVGIIMLDRHGKVLRLNPRATTLLAEQDGIALYGGTIALDDPALRRLLRERLARPDDATPLTLRIERPSGRGNLLLVVGSANAPEHVAASGGPAMVMFLNDPVHAPRVSPEAIRDLLGLTHSEATIAAHIAGGVSLADTATRLGISPNTVRAHLRAIFAKTGVKRQSQLVHLVHHSLPGLSRPAA